MKLEVLEIKALLLRLVKPRKVDLLVAKLADFDEVRNMVQCANATNRCSVVCFEKVSEEHARFLDGIHTDAWILKRLLFERGTLEIQ